MCQCSQHGVMMQVESITNQIDQTFIQTVCPFHGIQSQEEQTDENELAVPEFSPTYDHDKNRPEADHNLPTEAYRSYSTEPMRAVTGLSPKLFRSLMMLAGGGWYVFVKDGEVVFRY